MTERHGGKILIDQLEINGVDRIFSVPGESFLGVLDALHDSSIRLFTCRHEGGAAFMAEACGKMSGKPGVAIVTRGPGATNASSGVHVAMHDSTPMILLVGQVETKHRGREAFQEVDFDRFFDPICKWAAEIDRIERIPELVSKAFRIALGGRPGPVVLSLPEDILIQRGNVPDLPAIKPAPSRPDPASVRSACTRLAESERPLAIVGGSLWSKNASRLLKEFSLRLGVSLASSFRRQDFVDNRFENYVGDLSAGMNPSLANLVDECDSLLLLGTRFGDIASMGYTHPSINGSCQSILHVHPDPTEPSRVWPSEISVCSTPEHFLEAAMEFNALSPAPRTDWHAKGRECYENWLRPTVVPGQVQFPEVIRWLSDNLPEDAIITNCAGNYSAFLHRYFQFKRYGTQVAPTSGSMGYGFPASIAAKLQFPERVVVCFAGDGCFQMTLNELSTAAHYGANVVVVIANNGIYGTIRMHQEMNFPARVCGTSLSNPDYPALAKAYGGHGEIVRDTSEFPDAFKRSLQSEKLAVIELLLDPNAISSTRTIDDFRANHGKDAGITAP